MNAAEKFIADKLSGRNLAGNLRTLKPDNNLVDFCSNDYLGFARSGKLKNYITRELLDHPDSLNGSTGSRLLSGNLDYAEQLENELAIGYNGEAGLIFNSGYDANVGLFSSLPQRGDTIITDELIHASIIDGARLSYANRYTFKHNDVISLEEKLKNAKGVCYVAVESVYSMDGDSPPLEHFVALTKKYGAHLIVDEAHAVGLYPSGLVTALNLENKVFGRVITFGKALGSHGAIVIGSGLLRQFLINFARSFIYTTALSFHQLASIKAAHALFAESGLEIKQLKQNISLFKKGLRSGGALIESESAIQSVIIGNNEKARMLADTFKQAGLDVRAILSPTVREGTERLRLSLHSFNSVEQLTLLINLINTNI